MSKQPRGLGRGVEALLGKDLSQIRKPVEYVNKTVITPEVQGRSADIMLIPVDMIEPNPFQPRLSFDPESLNELADSVRSLGLIQPITVRRKASDKFQIISGERRYRACRMAGLDEIPAYIRETNDQGMLEMAIVENVQREDLDPIEVALSYQRLIEECNLTQEQMAARVGKKRASVTNFLRLLKLPAKVQHDLKVGILSVGHAKVILSVDDASVQESLCDLTVKEGLSVRQLEDRVRKILEPKKENKGEVEQHLPDEYVKVLEIVGKFFENSISLKRNKEGKGTMTIHFSSDAEVEKFLKALEDSKI
ncbi:MAG: ParB/RepB/Spo0J family partition protein [Candidatus Cryptobacteroides sp.]